MKKSQLRHIIKESIKELISEQTMAPDGIPITSQPCGGTGGGGSARRVKIKEPNGNLRNPQVGDGYCMSIGQGHHQWSAIQPLGCKWEIDRLLTLCDGCPPPIGQGIAGGMCKSACSQAPRILDLSDCSSTSCADSSQMSGITHCNQAPQPPSGCPATCDTSAWSGFQSWVSNWTSLPNFTSTNPNQPCTMICNKITTWENACQNAGPNWQNKLACKIQEAQNQASIHGCTC
jgi:hypothetical protein